MVAALGLVLAAPFMVLIALAIKLDSGGPVMFVDERAGRAGRPFMLLKFRTMRGQSPADAEPHSVWQRDDQARITRIGRWIRSSA